MPTTAELLEKDIPELEKEYGSDSPYVQQLKKQLAECMARDPKKKPSEVTYYTGTGTSDQVTQLPGQ